MASELGFVTEGESADLGFKADDGDLGFVEEAVPQPPSDPYNAIGRGMARLAATPQGQFEPAFEPPKAVVKALDRIIPSFEPETPEIQQAIDMMGLGGAQRAAAEVSKRVKGAIGTLASPGGAVLTYGTLGAPELIGGIVGVTSLPGVKEGLKEVAQGVKEGEPYKVAGGLTTAGVNALGVAGGGLGMLKGAMELPLRAKAGEATVAKAVAETPEVPVEHEAVQPLATETFKAVVEGAKTSEAPKAAEGEFQAAEKEALGASAGAQPKEPSASSQQVSTEVGGPVLRVGEVPRSETSGLPVNEGGEGVRGNENQGAPVAVTKAEEEIKPPAESRQVEQARMAEEQVPWGERGAMSTEGRDQVLIFNALSDAFGIRRALDMASGKEAYPSLAEFRDATDKYFTTEGNKYRLQLAMIKGRIEPGSTTEIPKREDFASGRDYYNKMFDAFGVFEKVRRGAMMGRTQEASTAPVPEARRIAAVPVQSEAPIGPPGELKPTNPVEPTLPAAAQGSKPPELTSEIEPTDFEASLRATIHSTFTRDEPTVANTAVDVPRIQSSPVTTPSTPESRPLGIVAPSSASFLGARFDAYRDLFAKAKSELSWKTFAQETLPKWTEAEREVGEAGAEYAAAPMVGEAMGLKFARDAMGEHAGDPVFDRKLGTAIKEDNLRSIRDGYERKAAEARRAADAAPNARESYLEDAALYDKAAQSVVTLIGAKNSPFRTEAEYRAFLRDADTVAALDRYKQLWAEQKEPLFREAAGIDPEIELAGRGLETGARINLTFEHEGEAKGKGITGQAAVGAQVRQLGTLLRRDPFLRQATGTGTSYHASLSETMADAFRREYPVAAQHKFIRLALERGVAQVGTKFKAPEGFKSYVLKLNPWQGKQLYVPNRLVPEYEALTGLSPGFQIPFVTPTAAVLTRQSILGLGEGSAHSANILLKLFTGITSEHPWREAFLSALPGRPDAIGAVARALMRGLRPDNAALLELAKINAAKRPYSGPIAAHILNPLDRGVRLLSADVFKGLAEAGIVKDTPTNLREFVNEVGNYTQSVQSPLVRNLRSMQVQPFATGFRTAKVQVAKRLALAPGLEATTTMNAVALRAAILGKFIGAATTIATLNYILNGSARGLPGTKLGAVSWQGKDGRTRQFDLGAFLGATAGARALGIAQVIEAKERGLGSTTAAAQGARGIATTLTSQLAGPSVRFATVALTGKDPYGMQVAPMSPQGSDPVKNIVAALQGANPIVDVASRIHAGQPWSDVWQRQLTRYSPSTPSSLSTSGKFAKVVTNKNLIEYADWVASQARKLDQSERSAFVREQLARDGVVGPQLRAAQTEIKRKGVYKYK